MINQKNLKPKQNLINMPASIYFPVNSTKIDCDYHHNPNYNGPKEYIGLQDFQIFNTSGTKIQRAILSKDFEFSIHYDANADEKENKTLNTTATHYLGKSVYGSCVVFLSNKTTREFVSLYPDDYFASMDNKKHLLEYPDIHTMFHPANQCHNPHRISLKWKSKLHWLKSSNNTRLNVKYMVPETGCYDIYYYRYNNPMPLYMFVDTNKITSQFIEFKDIISGLIVVQLSSDKKPEKCKAITIAPVLFSLSAYELLAICNIIFSASEKALWRTIISTQDVLFRNILVMDNVDEFSQIISSIIDKFPDHPKFLRLCIILARICDAPRILAYLNEITVEKKEPSWEVLRAPFIQLCSDFLKEIYGPGPYSKFIPENGRNLKEDLKAHIAKLEKSPGSEETINFSDFFPQLVVARKSGFYVQTDAVCKLNKKYNKLVLEMVNPV